MDHASVLPDEIDGTATPIVFEFKRRYIAVVLAAIMAITVLGIQPEPSAYLVYAGFFIGLFLTDRHLNKFARIVMNDGNIAIVRRNNQRITITEITSDPFVLGGYASLIFQGLTSDGQKRNYYIPFAAKGFRASQLQESLRAWRQRDMSAGDISLIEQARSRESHRERWLMAGFLIYLLYRWSAAFWS